MQAARRHEAEQTEGFERNRLAAGVRAGDHKGVVLAADSDVDGDRLVLVEQRMAGAEQTDAAAAFEQHRRGRVHCKGQLRAGENEVQFGQRIVVLLDGTLVHRHLSGERGKDSFDFGLLAALKDLDLVVDLDDLLRLDKDGRAGGRGIVHESGNVAAVLGLDRDNEAAVSLGDDGFLKVLGALAGNQAIERFADAAGDAAQLAADGKQLGGRAVRDLLLGDNRGGDGLFEGAVAGQQAENRRERGLFLALGVVGKGAACGLEQARDAQQLARVERAAAVRANEDRADLTDAAEGRAALPHHAVLGVRGLLHMQRGLLPVIERTQRAAFLLGLVGGSLCGKAFEDFVIFQCF